MKEEAERQGAPAKRNRNRLNDLTTLGYEAAMRSLEELAEEGDASRRGHPDNQAALRGG
jgi:hypothetical protein